MRAETALGLWNASSSAFHERKTPLEIKRMIKSAYALGIRTFDTAYSYQDASNLLYSALQNEMADITVISKVMPVPTLRKKTESELKRLRREYIDVLLIHWPGGESDIYRSLEIMDSLLKEEKIKGIGLSNFPYDLFLKYKKDFPVTYSEDACSIFWKEREKEDVKRIAYGIMGFGALYGKNTSLFTTGNGGKAHFEKIISFLDFLETKYSASKDEIALSYAKEKADVILLGCHSIDNIRRLYLSSLVLDKSDILLLDSLAEMTRGKTGKENVFGHNWRQDGRN